jgi:hypothetical protein
MKTLAILTLSMALACKSVPQGSNEQANESIANMARTGPIGTVENQEDVFEGRLTPSAIEGCLRKVSLGEPFEFDLSRNPFYLRLNLYGKGGNDYAIVIRGTNTKKLGLLICKDASEPVVLGELSNPKVLLTDMDKDNFISSYWSVATREEYKKMFTKSAYERFAAPSNPAGEILVLSYEIDGILYVWWDGKKFETYSE